MSSCNFDLKEDFSTVVSFIKEHTLVLVFFFALQWLSNHALDRATRPVLNLFQRLVLAVITTTIVFAGNQMMGAHGNFSTLLPRMFMM